MVIVGAKGLAKEVFEIFVQRDNLANLFFFDNISKDLPEKLFDQFPILKTIDEVKEVFNRTDNSFTLGLGNPLHRYKMNNTFTLVGGNLRSAISLDSKIGKLKLDFGDGCTILPGAVITTHVSMGKGCLINPNCTLSHDSVLGNFVELSPGVCITGGCQVGDFCQIGTNATLLPKVKLGCNVVVGAGAVVTKDVPDNSLVVGIPARIKKSLEPIFL